MSPIFSPIDVDREQYTFSSRNWQQLRENKSSSDSLGLLLSPRKKELRPSQLCCLSHCLFLYTHTPSKRPFSSLTHLSRALTFPIAASIAKHTRRAKTKQKSSVKKHNWNVQLCGWSLVLQKELPGVHTQLPEPVLSVCFCFCLLHFLRTPFTISLCLFFLFLTTASVSSFQRVFRCTCVCVCVSVVRF